MKTLEQVLESVPESLETLRRAFVEQMRIDALPGCPLPPGENLKRCAEQLNVDLFNMSAEDMKYLNAEFRYWEG